MSEESYLVSWSLLFCITFHTLLLQSGMGTWWEGELRPGKCSQVFPFRCSTVAERKRDKTSTTKSCISFLQGLKKVEKWKLTCALYFTCMWGVWVETVSTAPKKQVAASRALLFLLNSSVEDIDVPTDVPVSILEYKCSEVVFFVQHFTAITQFQTSNEPSIYCVGSCHLSLPLITRNFKDKNIFVSFTRVGEKNKEGNEKLKKNKHHLVCFIQKYFPSCQFESL